MTSLKFEKVKTTKDKDAVLCNSFLYNYKHENKDSSKHFVCNIPGCYSSLTLLNDVISKVNGKKIVELWNQYEDNDNKRTNNDAEGYNLWLDLWLHKHPNIWNFIKKIKS